MIPPVMPDPNHPAGADAGRRRHPPAAWREELRTAIRSAQALCEAVGLTREAADAAIDDPGDFPVLVPRSYVARMRRGDARDPLLMQVLARDIERVAVNGFVTDPLREREAASAGVLRKYARRALLVTTAACPVHCRYCFRRHFPYSEQLAARDGWQSALDALRAAPDVEEVILSGGDPLTLSTAKLAELVAALENIATVTTLRVHTRFPIVVPSRVTADLQRMLDESRLRTVIVVHCNHANELDDPAVADALHALSRSCDLLLNQSVLLRGVNDDVAALRELSMSLFRANVMPYYLHMLDPVAGSAHYAVAESHGRWLLGKLRAELPGYLVPRLVREDPGALSKTPVC